MSLFDQLLSRYTIQTPVEHDNAVREIMQEITLAGLYRGGFFEKAAFYGGTCLRIFHGMQRFSEDLDFSLMKPEKDFSLESYFESILNEFDLVGRDVQILRKTKQISSSIESAFLKDDTVHYNILFNTLKTIKIKLEVDTNPPEGFQSEYKLLMHPFSFMTRCYSLPDLFAGKMHAFLFRKWKTRVKGRDWYDFQWYVSQSVQMNLKHFIERSRQSRDIDDESFGKQDFLELLCDRITRTDISLVKKDVLPFLKNKNETDIWSQDYFLQLTGLMKIL
jgi:predicted nucleotidyltransferase component of viral defense system